MQNLSLYSYILGCMHRGTSLYSEMRYSDVAFLRKLTLNLTLTLTLTLNLTPKPNPYPKPNPKPNP